MKKITLFISLLIVMILLCGCKKAKRLILISNYNLVRVNILGVEGGNFYINEKSVYPSSEDRETTDYVIVYVEVLKSYTDLVENNNTNPNHKGMILKLGIPVTAKNEIMKHDELLLLTQSREIFSYDLEQEQDDNNDEVDLFIEYVVNKRINSGASLKNIIPINDGLIDIQNENFDFSDFIRYDKFVEDSKKLKDGLSIDEFEEWFKLVYKSQVKVKKNERNFI